MCAVYAKSPNIRGEKKTSMRGIFWFSSSVRPFDEECMRDRGRCIFYEPRERSNNRSPGLFQVKEKKEKKKRSSGRSVKTHECYPVRIDS